MSTRIYRMSLLAALLALLSVACTTEHPGPEDDVEIEGELPAPAKEDAPACSDGETAEVECGDGFTQTQVCTNGKWLRGECNECEDGDVEEFGCVTGVPATRECVSGVWGEWSDCLEEVPQRDCLADEYCCEPSPNGGCYYCAGPGGGCP